jgi:uncharacterized Zn-binding protein involved in type VI secretion
MSQAAKKGDQIVPLGVHFHFVKVPAPVFIAQLPHPCVWEITKNLSDDVFIHEQAAAMEGSGGENTGPKAHKALPPGTDFVRPPPNMDQAVIAKGSGSRSVFINKRPAARAGDIADTCNEPVGPKSGQVVVAGACTVFIGG